MKYPLLTLSLFSILLISCSKNLSQHKITSDAENGVSEALAFHRKSVLSQVQYTIALSIPESRTEKIRGTESISFQLKKDGKPLQLDFNDAPNKILRITVNGRDMKPVHQNEHLIISTQYLKNGNNKVDIDFEAGELSLNRNNEFLYTLLVPDRARTVFPCFDQPDIKARFKLSLTIPQQWHALSNAAVADSFVSSTNKTYHFRTSDLFSTYLFSFVAGKFSVAEQNVAGRNMRLYHRETDSIKLQLSVDTIFSTHASALQFLERYTNTPYPFQKLDFAAIPDFQYGGMEHVGAIDYKASSLFLDSSATKDQENARNNLIVHETAHMWFGDLVTMQWFNDVWTKEVFANFMADKFIQHTKDSSSFGLRFLLTHYPRAYSIDRTAGANAIRQHLPNLQEAGSLYGPIIYNKAPIMMRQLEKLMGADTFREGIRSYIKKYSYSNATWPDLINILDSLTPADLKDWNKNWVNTPGRPLLNYNLRQKEGKILSLIMTQEGERTANYILPQLFKIGLVYPDKIEEIEVLMNADKVEIAAAAGKGAPLYILFNTSGEGYGLFPIDTNTAPVDGLKDPIMRAAAYINLFENMISGRFIQPMELLHNILQIVQQGKEPEELILNMLASHISETFWRYIPSRKREAIAGEVENVLWNAIQKEATPNKKKVLFRTYQNITLSDSGLQRLYSIWQNQTPPAGIRMSEEDYTTLAMNLAIKNYEAETLLSKQLGRINNPDRKQRFQFLLPTLSTNERVRDSFFYSLKDPAIRKKESWVADALYYLHHPLRSPASIRYLQESLELLQEVQKTGDIFFPAAWLNASFSGYQSKKAADIIRAFLQKHPDYNAQLKMKILQAADPVFRAELLAK